MKIATPDMIAKIDRFAIDTLGIPEEDLIRRAGADVADALLEEKIFSSRASYPKTVIFAGGGNNGADGYAAALSLAERGVPVFVMDVFGKGQRSEGGKKILAEYIEKFGEPYRLEALSSFADAEVFVDAMFGTGFSGELPTEGRLLMKCLKRRDAFFAAVDVPFGVNAADGSVDADALACDVTVVLSYMKKGLLSYPAAEKCGKIVFADIGLDIPEIHKAFPALEDSLDEAYVKKYLPHRPANSHKGSFGKALLVCGSKKYRGAATLATLAALRAGVGLLHLYSEKEVVSSMGKKFPEVIYHEIKPFSEDADAIVRDIAENSKEASAILIGPGCDGNEGLFKLIVSLLEIEGCPIVLDATAFSALAAYRAEAEKALSTARRDVLMTPHPLEFSRLSGVPIAEIQAERIRYADLFSKKWHSSVLLKGAGTVIASDGAIHVNTTGSSALAKGGSGDVLAGLVTALAAQGATPLHALSLGAYLHGRAGDVLAEELSEYGVLPSELPKQIALEIAKIQKM